MSALQLLYNLPREAFLAFELEKQKKNTEALIKKAAYSENIEGNTHKPKVLRFHRKPLFAEGAETDKSSKLPTIILFGLLS